MKKLLYVIAATIMLSTQTNAQAFDASTKMLTIGIGGADMFHIPAGYNYYTGFYSPLTAQLYVQGEFAVHKYVGVGFDATLGGRPSNYGYSGGGYYGYGYGYGWRSEFNIAVGALANFHFYQLIADKTGKDIHADKLDIYVGLSTGGGVAIHPSDAYFNTTNIDGIFYIGPQVGVHYFFNDKIGINGELGYGKTFVSAGVTFKLGGGSNSGKKK
jgi:hypothetical protein